MNDLAQVLAAFPDATGCEAAVWTQPDSARAAPALDASTPHAPPLAAFPAVADGARTDRDAPAATILVAAVPGPRRAWLALGPCRTPGVRPRTATSSFLLPVVTQYLQSALEVEHAANELAERYEEINLLYTISEILGRTVALDEAARTILIEVSETVGARRASVLVHDRATNTLRAVAALGADLASVPPIDVDDPCSVSAHVFRTQHPMLAEADEMLCPQEAELSPRRDALRADHVDGTRAARRRAARRRESVGSAIGTAVHRRRPEAHRRDRDADRHGDSEHAAGARVGGAAATRARDAARARSADEAAAEQRRRRAGGDRRRARRSGRERRRRLLQPVPARVAARPA